jgi:fumarylacetoacetase
MPDATHNPALRSWVESANGHADFPIQNLPLGTFIPLDMGGARVGVAIGEMILDLTAAPVDDDIRDAAAHAGLNTLFALGEGPRKALRARLSELLSNPDHRAAVEPHLHPMEGATMLVPAKIGDYTDFYVGIHHATNVGKVFRPDNPLLPNYKHVPIGYHGRASSVRASGTDIRRPKGQLKAPNSDTPRYAPCERLDYELELAVWIGPGNTLGNAIPIDRAPAHVAGYGLLNDWSARDIQAWEYQPLGPFLAKNFGSTVSPWVITPEALEPFRIAQPARPEGDPAPLPYLLDENDQNTGAFDLSLEVLILTPGMREKGMAPHRLALSNARHMYWTVAQMVAHHSSNGCDLNPGDLLGSGTLSAPDAAGFGSLLEITKGGTTPITLPSGETRRFLQDGDEVILRAYAAREGFARIGFGDCRATILPAN